MDKQKLKKSVENFMNKDNTDSYMMLVGGKAGGYLTGSEFADNCGPGTNRELVAIKQSDGSVKFYGSLRNYEHDTKNN
jgi:hypothetical protein